jgi:predicted amidophosphoribosyltransferase
VTSYPSSLRYVSALQYAPRGRSPTSQVSRTVTYKIKTDGFMGRTRVMAHAARRVAEQYRQVPFLQDAFGPEVTLVPVPRSTPLRAGFLWPAEQICACLLAEGLGRDIEQCLVRTRPVPRSRIAATGQRPSPPEHCDSTDVRVPGVRQPLHRITLVDDVITRGSTFMGMVPRLQVAYPEATIVCFALVRTVGTGEVETILAPTEGTITYREGQLVRQP